MTSVVARGATRLSGHSISGDTVVMIVENDPVERAFLVDVCMDAGFGLSSIHQVETLERAIPALNRHQVDLVLLDLALDRDDNPLPGIGLLERWEFETRKQKIPVIVVSRYADVLKPKARDAAFEVIPKPGAHEGEKRYFCMYLEHVIREAISQRSETLTVWDRIRQQFARLKSIPVIPAIDEDGGVVIHPTSNAAKAVVWLVIIVKVGVWLFGSASIGLALYRIASSLRWPMYLTMGAFAIVLALVIYFRAKTAKQRG